MWSDSTNYTIRLTCQHPPDLTALQDPRGTTLWGVHFDTIIRFAFNLHTVCCRHIQGSSILYYETYEIQTVLQSHTNSTSPLLSLQDFYESVSP